MFGYVNIYKEDLSAADVERYRAYYCGLCRTIGKNHGNFCRTTLTYDMTFLSVILSKIYCKDQEVHGKEKCVIHPIKKHGYITCGEISDYAAAINVALAYYKCLDDWHDNKNIVMGSEACLLKREFAKIEKKYPEKCRAIKKCIDGLSALEKTGELNPDIPAKCFGQLLGEIFAYKNDEFREILYTFGFNLGKFIYIIDACCDIKTDLRNRKYNPMISIKSENRKEILDMLSDMCYASFLKIEDVKDDKILQNILNSGIWVKYYIQQQKENKSGDGVSS